MVWFVVLGPLLVRDGDAAEAVWDGAPSAGAETTLRSHVSRLR